MSQLESNVFRKKSLFEFDTIFDITTTSMKYIIEHTTNKKYFKPCINKYISDNILINFMLDSNTTNPFKILFKEEYYDDCDELYDDFLKHHYEDIISSNLLITDIYRLYLTYLEASELNIDGYINCKNDIEFSFMEKLKDKAPFKIVENNTNMEDYNFLYLNDILRLPSFNNMTAKRFYIVRKKSNMINDEFMEKNQIFKIFLSSILITYIDMYKDIKYIRER